MKYRDWLKLPRGERPTYVIAEIGQNHNGDIEVAKELIDAAADAGVQAVKFQKRTLPDCVPKDQRDVIRFVPGIGDISYLEYRERMELDWDSLWVLWCYAQSIDLDAFISVWDANSVIEGFVDRQLRPTPMAHWSCLKIPSAKITDADLLKVVRKTELPVIVSTGMSTAEEVDALVRHFADRQLTIMHCHSAYPAPTEELNLRVIETLRRTYPWATIGYSGHEWGIATTVWAVILGAEVVERHITLRRGMWGSDHFSSLEPDIFKKLVNHIRSVPRVLGTGEKRLWESEMAKRASLRG